jgi:serine/threonine protein kinase
MAVSPRRRTRRISALTRTGNLVGTPPYIAPELVGGPEALSPAADLFAFGVLAWELLAGERPFQRPVAVARLAGEALPEAPSLATRWKRGSPEVIGTIDRCLAIDPLARPHVEEVAAVLARFATVRTP